MNTRKIDVWHFSLRNDMARIDWQMNISKHLFPSAIHSNTLRQRNICIAYSFYLFIHLFTHSLSHSLTHLFPIPIGLFVRCCPKYDVQDTLFVFSTNQLLLHCFRECFCFPISWKFEWFQSLLNIPAHVF